MLTTMLTTMATVLPHLLLLTFAPMVSLACPHGCQCYSDVPSVHCYYLGITAVPSGFPPNTTLLAIRHCNITALRRGDFSGMPLLATLYLDWNNISTIEPGTFDGLFHLQSLAIGGNRVAKLPPGLFKDNKLTDFDGSDNRIEAIPSGVFTNHSSLISLILNGNRISMLGDDAFAGLPQLVEIQINDNLISRLPADALKGASKLWTLSMPRNAITKIEQGALSDCTSLYNLDLSGNQLTTLEGTLKVQLDLTGNRITNISTLSVALESITFLDYLTLTSNPVVYLPKHAFPAFIQTDNVDLNDMKLRAVDKDAFEWMGKLQSINMAKNRLRFIPGKLFANISVEKVNLEGNPWYCDCQMYEFAQWMKTNNMSEKFDVVCDGPETLNGTYLSDIPLKNLTCDCVHYQAPTINTTGSDTVVVAGHDARLVCNVTGCPEAAVIWTTPLGDAFSEDSDDPRFSVLSDGGLEIHEAKTIDAGMYICTAINYIGSSQEIVVLGVTG
uniref:Ig-like domain-containing protein n=1 Tax=Branchiostoma floridae TaxID=7739 RepID=C3ZHD3_BRAFL|eukprot:XP_002591917.1 hypothetical protein BRAFLDRAFT_236952 [Branchiostoma floridae]